MKSYSNAHADENEVSVCELRYLLNSILEQHANIRIRYQMRGEVWTNQYMRVLLVTEKGVILNDELTNKITSIQFLGDISQFQLDKPYDSYEFNFQYLLKAD